MDGIDFLWLYATSPMADEMQLLNANNSDAPISCYCCGRISTEWALPLYQPRIDNYIKMEVPICAPCNTLFHGSFKYMGIEKGTPEKPAASGKLGMLVGCGLIVTQKQKLLLTNPGWDKRLRAASQPIFALHQVSGRHALEYALNFIMSLPQDEFPILYVSDIGRRKSELVTNLKLSQNPSKIQVCSGEAVFQINTALLHNIRTMQQHDKNGWKKLENYIFKSCHGQIPPNDPELHSFLTANAEALSIARSLPADPHNKLQLLRVL